MLNSLDSGCTADVQGIDCKMRLAGYVFPLLLFQLVCTGGVEAFCSFSAECYWCGSCRSPFLAGMNQDSAVKQGMHLRESSRQALYSNVLDRLLL